MKTSESIKNLAKALLEAQRQTGAAVKGSKNPFFKSNYADLPTVMEVVKEPLNNAGVLVLQPSSNRDGKNFITTTLVHAESGEWMQSETEVVSAKQNDPQAFGAAQTYARRFGLQSLLFIPAEDDDGNSISNRDAKPTYTRQTPTPTVNPPSNPIASPAQVGKASNTINVNAEFDAIKKPEATTLAPLKTSSFRKPAKAAPTKATEAPTTEAASDWN
jgi:hypothetical protein